jgi:hypothetical protein
MIKTFYRYFEISQSLFRFCFKWYNIFPLMFLSEKVCRFFAQLSNKNLFAKKNIKVILYINKGMIITNVNSLPILKLTSHLLWHWFPAPLIKLVYCLVIEGIWFQIVNILLFPWTLTVQVDGSFKKENNPIKYNLH